MPNRDSATVDILPHMRLEQRRFIFATVSSRRLGAERTAWERKVAIMQSVLGEST